MVGDFVTKAKKAFEKGLKWRGTSGRNRSPFLRIGRAAGC